MGTTRSLCYIPEAGTTLKVNCPSVKKREQPKHLAGKVASDCIHGWIKASVSVPWETGHLFPACPLTRVGGLHHSRWCQA